MMLGGLELKIEKAFDFVHDQGSKIVKKEQPGYDVSIYCGSKLCLSPHEYYYKGDFEKDIKKDLKKSVVKSVYSKLVKEVARLLEMGQIYHIKEANLGGRNFDYTGHPNFAFVLPSSENFDANYKELFVFDKDGCLLPKVIKKFWARTYPVNVYVDHYYGNDLTIYFTNDFEKFSKQLKKYSIEEYSIEKENETMLKKAAEFVLSNLSYGYRARLESDSASILKKLRKALSPLLFQAFSLHLNHRL